MVLIPQISTANDDQSTFLDLVSLGKEEVFRGDKWISLERGKQNFDGGQGQDLDFGGDKSGRDQIWGNGMETRWLELQGFGERYGNIVHWRLPGIYKGGSSKDAY